MINPSRRIASYQYAIRNIVAAAEVLERAGRKVTYLNIGDPQVFGFRPPLHVVEPVQRALRDRFTGYAHSKGLFEARQASAGLLFTPSQAQFTVPYTSLKPKLVLHSSSAQPF